MCKTKLQAKRGFTLIEILVVIGLIAILAAIVLIAINPARQFAQARDTARTNDVNAIVNAVGQYTADSKGILPAAITTTVKNITGVVGATNIDLCPILMPTYVASLPGDPSTGVGTPVTTCNATYDTKYSIVKDATGRVTVSAVGEITNPISITR